MSLTPTNKQMPEDFSEDLKNKVRNYIDAGLPELAKYVSDHNKIKKMITQYLNGANIDELSYLLGWPEEVVGFLIFKHDLYETKQKMIKSMSLTLSEKIKILKLKHFDFMLKTVDKIMDHYVNEFYSSKPKPIDSIDTEWFKLYMKIIEALLSEKDPEASAKQLLELKNNIHTTMPHITLQLPSNSKIQKEIDGSVTISSDIEAQQQKQNVIKEVLKALADLKKNSS